MTKPLVSVIIPVKEIGNYLRKENLPAMDKQVYKNFEVIVLPNTITSQDKQLLRKYHWLKIIPTGKITRPARKRDMGVKNARGQIIAFIDDDAYPSPCWLEEAVAVFEKKRVAAVCGPGLLPRETNIWEKIFDETLKTDFGSGGYQYRFIKAKARYVDDYPSMNFLIKKNVFKKLGGFDNEYWPGEDSKLCEDLVYKEKRQIFYHPDVAVFHHRRNNLNGFLKQHSNYGFHRGAFFTQGDSNSRRITYLVPTTFVLYLLTLIGLNIFFFFTHFPKNFLIFFIPLLLYFFIQLGLFFKSFLETKNLFISITTPFIIFAMHVAYGIMFIKGFIKGLTHKKQIYG